MGSQGQHHLTHSLPLAACPLSSRGEGRGRQEGLPDFSLSLETWSVLCPGGLCSFLEGLSGRCLCGCFHRLCEGYGQASLADSHAHPHHPLPSFVLFASKLALWDGSLVLGPYLSISSPTPSRYQDVNSESSGLCLSCSLLSHQDLDTEQVLSESSSNKWASELRASRRQVANPILKPREGKGLSKTTQRLLVKTLFSLLV